MTPKEKAIELINKFYGLPTGNTNRCVDWLTATESALITVDEILSLMIKFHNRHIEDNSNEIIFWELVKEEINKM
jgi:hypothetical protein